MHASGRHRITENYRGRRTGIRRGCLDQAMSMICTILARGGSKGVKNKNIRMIVGKPLIAHTVLQAKESGLFDVIAASSDSEQILQVAKDWGVQELVQRPREMATDYAPKLEAVKHCVLDIENRLETKFDVVVDLDPTSPLRSVEDIRHALAMVREDNADNIITGALARKSPYFNLVRVDNGRPRLCVTPTNTITSRQGCPPCFDMNASIYVWKRDALFNHSTIMHEGTRFYEMPIERSWEIDTPLDFDFVELLMNKRVESRCVQ